MIPGKYIKTEKFLLRDIEEADLENIFKGLSNPEVIKYYGVSYATLEDTREQMKFFSDLEKNKTGKWWAVCSPDNTTFFGAGGLNNYSPVHKKAEIGFWLMPEFWGKGLMTAALPMICNYAFNHMDVHRIEGIVESENEACRVAMQKLNFSYEGTMKECEIKNGKFIDLDIYALINASRS